MVISLSQRTSSFLCQTRYKVEKVHYLMFPGPLIAVAALVKGCGCVSGMR